MPFLTMIRMIYSAITKPQQRIAIPALPQGRILDIGGGGEGVIAQAGASQVVSVDRFLSEILEARGKAPQSAWVTADATALPCQQHSFHHATAFFSCMYMKADVQQKVFQEAYRVLKPGAEFWIWDMPMTSKSREVALRLQVTLHNHQVINTTYGVKAKDQSADSLQRLLQKAGFVTELVSSQKYWFLVKARKAAS